MWSVRFEEVTKQYPRSGPSYPTIGTALRTLPANLRARLRRETPERSGRKALDDVSFSIDAGESFALIGPNGAGKSTALRLLARISPPTAGRVRGRGRVGALMEVGSGMHTELTGRENVWLYGSILGIQRSEIKRRFDEIVDFAGIEAAIDMPVKFYSSGMQLRLGFSIASHLEPDVFAVDEALSVGDSSFQQKCVERMGRLVQDGATVLFVSHDLFAVESICQRGLMLDEGREITQGPVRDVLATYLRFMEDRRIDLRSQERNAGVVRVVEAECLALDGSARNTLAPGEGLEIVLQFECDRPLVRPMVVLTITDGRPGAIVECSMLEDGQAPAKVDPSWECRLRIDSLPLRPRLYQVFAEVRDEQGRGDLMARLEVGAFRVDAERGAGPQAVMASALGGPLDVAYRWDVRS
jgi:ABC-type polysaccharide/polyol phosphate transport system ATPase subunit